MKVLTVANRKGGAGKSTCAAHLAIEAVKSGIKTILIDLDPQKTLETWWEKREKEDVDLLEGELFNLPASLERIKKSGYGLCIIDTPGDISANARAGIKLSDLVLIPSKPTAPDLGAIGRTIGIIQEEDKKFVFLITQAIPRAKAALQAASVLSGFGSVAPSTIPNKTAYCNAMGSGFSAAELDHKCGEDLEEIWNFISNQIGFNKKKITKRKIA